jgi:hypothetical protein
MVAFLRFATAFIGTVGFNANTKGKNDGKGLHYPEFRIGKDSRISIGRLIADTEPGEKFIEPEDDYDWTVQAIAKKNVGTLWPSKFWRGREDAIRKILAAYDGHAGRSGLSISRGAYEVALRSCLSLLDRDRAG